MRAARRRLAKKQSTMGRLHAQAQSHHSSVTALTSPRSSLSRKCSTTPDGVVVTFEMRPLTGAGLRRTHTLRRQTTKTTKLETIIHSQAKL
mmetsp:Transcript_21453/g.49973  ORF Transcript_21453/g.49973 Transcript_21453/m.49973 type:complete len:91 (+) Transcript_21453:1074-1346(+)